MRKCSLIILLHTMISHQVYAFSQTQSTCPKRYVGKTIKVENIVTPLSFNSTGPWIQVDFKVDETLKGAEVERLIFKIMKANQFMFEEGEEYEISMREKFLCSMRKI